MLTRLNPYSIPPHFHAAALFFIALIASLPGITTLPPLDRDEARFAQASLQMLESGDFVTIKFQDQERNKKPAGIYWLQSTSVHFFSAPQKREIWAYRVPSVIGAIIAIFMTWGLGRALFDHQTAFLGAILLAASPALMAEATIAKTDAMLLAMICTTQFSLAQVYRQQFPRLKPKSTPTRPRKLFIHNWGYALLFWLSFTAAVFIKGPIGPLITGLTFLTLIIQPNLIERRSFAFSFLKALKPISGLFIFSACLLPWILAIDEATQGRFFAESLGKDMFGKLGQIQEHHSGPPGYHFLLLPLLLWPASHMLLPAIKHIWANKLSPNFWFLISWIVPAWLLFELTATKLPHYVLPLYPAVALLIAATVIDFHRQQHLYAAKIKIISMLVFSSIGLGVGLAILGLPHIFKTGRIDYLAYLLALILGAGIIITISNYWRGKVYQATIMSVGLSLFACASLLMVVLPSLDKLGVSVALSRSLKEHNYHRAGDKDSHSSPVTIVGYYEPSAVFLLGTQTTLTDDPMLAVLALEKQGQPVFIEQKFLNSFLEHIENNNLSVQPLAKINGFNYSNGNSVSLTLYVSNTEKL